MLLRGFTGRCAICGASRLTRTWIQIEPRCKRCNFPIERNEGHFVGAVGVGRLFDCSLNLQAEYLFNGAGDDDDRFTALDRVTNGRALQMSEHLAAAMMSYDLLPLLTGSLATIISLSDQSGVIQPGLSYSIADESDVLAGALIAWGKRPGGTTLFDTQLRSEFGTYPNFYYVQYRFYF